MRTIIPEKSLAVCLLVTVISTVTIVLICRDWNFMDTGKSIANLSIALVVFITASIAGAKELLYGPIFRVYGDKLSCRFQILPEQEVVIDPLYGLAGNFLLVDMVFDQSLYDPAVMKSFRLCNNGKWAQRIVCQLDVYGLDEGNQESLVTRKTIKWHLSKQSTEERFDGRSTHYEVLAIGESHIAYRVQIHSIRLDGGTFTLSSAKATQDLWIRVVLTVGIRFNHMFSLHESQVGKAKTYIKLNNSSPD